MLILFRKTLIFTGILLAVAVFHISADACSCYRTETVDKEFAKTPNVAIVKLQSIKENDNEPRSFFFSVEKVFKGELKPTEVLTFRIFSNCSLFFDEEQIGTEFLFYLGNRPEKDKLWEVSRCSNSGTIKAKKNDLRYLENESKVRGKTRLSGRIVKWVVTLNEFAETTAVPLANRKIRIVGNGKTVNLTTDETGAFEVYDLTPGKYKIYPGKSEGFALLQSEKTGFEEVEIKAQSQIEQDFYYQINNSISGKVVDREGKPLENINVDLYSVELEKLLGFAHKTRTDETGKFEISAIPEGTYKIVVNSDDPFDRTRRSPLFGTFYYPSTEALEKAAEITVGANFFMKDLILVPLAATEMIAVSGRMMFADGKPAAEKFVEFIREEDISKSSFEMSDSGFEAKTDKNGEFTIKIPKGREGVLRGIFYYFSAPDKNKGCSELEELLKQNGTNFMELETNRFGVKKNTDLSAVELKFTFSSCEKAKID